MPERARPDLASAMFPSLSQAAKAREVAAAQQRAEQKRRNAQLAADLRAINARMRKQTTKWCKHGELKWQIEIADIGPEAASLPTKLLNALSELVPVRAAHIQAAWHSSASMLAITRPTVLAQVATEASPCTTIVRFNQHRSEMKLLPTRCAGRAVLVK
jgi:hypothetical protein